MNADKRHELLVASDEVRQVASDPADAPRMDTPTKDPSAPATPDRPASRSAASAVDGSLSDGLRSRLSPTARVLTSPDACRTAARDLAELPAVFAGLFGMTPSMVVQPATTADVATAVTWARQHRLPLTPRALASSAYGGAVPVKGGVVLDLLHLTAIGDVDVEQRQVTVQAGVGWGDLDTALARHGLEAPTCPSSRFSTVGGWVNTGGYGINAMGQGHFSRHVLALEVVLPDGTVVDAVAGDDVFERAFGTEGQFGVVTALTLRLRLRRTVRPHLAVVGSTADAVALVKRLRDSGCRLEHVKLLCRRQMANLNRLHQEGHPGKTLVPDGDGVLFTMQDAEAEAHFAAAVASTLPEGMLAPYHVARGLWQERFFPMAAKRFGPSLLAAQVEVPLDQAAAFIDDAAALAARFGVTSLTESYVLDTNETLVMPMFACDARRPSYLLHLVLVQLMTRLGLRRGGRPYAAGVWNGPFAAAKFGDRYPALVQAKRTIDPDHLFNPGKFPRVRTRLWPFDLVFWPPLFSALMLLLLALSPLVGAVARVLHRGGPARPAMPRSRRDHQQVPLDDAHLEEAIRGCTGCGDCLPVCPAHVVTGDETVVGREKLRTGLRVLHGAVVSKGVSDQTFLCMLCHACEDVCQSSLPLVSMYGAIEAKLAVLHGRPDALIGDFIARAEALPAFHHLVGTVMPPPPAPAMPAGFLPPSTPPTSRPAPSKPPTSPPSSAPPAMVPSAMVPSTSTLPARYAIVTKPAPSSSAPVGRFHMERGSDCINCGLCVSACVYGVHHRDVTDIRQMAAPESQKCKNCFRCVQECPRQTLTMSLNPAYDRQGAGIFTPDVVTSLMQQAENGAIPVLGQGYRGTFSGPGFDGIWTDMSEIVRPTRDGIHGREYISTSIDLGRRPERLVFDVDDHLVGEPAATRSLAIPVLLSRPPALAGPPLVTESMLEAATTLQTLVELTPDDWRPSFAPHINVVALVLSSAEDAIDDETLQAAPLVDLDVSTMDDAAAVIALRRLRQRFPAALLAARLPCGPDSAARGVTLAAADVVDVLRLVGEDGTALPSTSAPSLVSVLPRVHDALVAARVRDRVSVLASGGIAMAEHVPKAIILGADGVAIDWPLAIALGCVATPSCTAGRCADGGCGADLDHLDTAWGKQRLENLMAAWRNQLLEVMGAMGLREVRRLRGERGRAMFARELEQRHFYPLRVSSPSSSSSSSSFPGAGS